MSEGLIHVEDVPRCPVCGSGEKKILYTGLKDHLFGAPGEWTLKECSGCGLVFLDPRPTLEDIRKAYATYYTHSFSSPPGKRSSVQRLYQEIKRDYLGVRWGYYSELKTWQRLLGLLMYLHPGRRADLDFSVMYLKARPGGRLLDVGCGSGESMERLQNLGWQAEGLDFDDKAVRAARARGLRVRLGTLQEQSYAGESFDVITMSHVIEHVHDPLNMLRECRRILKLDGRLVIVTPNVSSLGHKWFKEAWRGLEPPRHLQIFTPLTLRKLAGAAGFDSCMVVTTIRDAHGLMIASSSIKRTGTYVMGSPRPLRTQLWGRCMQYLEWIIAKGKPDAGEEIAAVLEK